jgi:aspartyl-tRNA(Asn)/glutamyl-tRNA(Gln) amidotransferase subunit C
MKLTIEEVKKIASLARLRLTETELSKFQDQLSSILDYVVKLNEVDTKNVEPVTGGTDLTSITREDKAEETTEELKEDLLNAAPLREKDLVKTRGVFE